MIELKASREHLGRIIDINGPSGYGHRDYPKLGKEEIKKRKFSGSNGMKGTRSKYMNSKDQFSMGDIVQKLGIPRGRLQEWMNMYSVLGHERGATSLQTKGVFSRFDVYQIALFDYLLKERSLSGEEAAELIELWIHTRMRTASTSKDTFVEEPKNPPNVLIFINTLTEEGNKLVCEPVAIYGRKKQGEGFRFFKALGGILKTKLKDRSWEDFLVVNIGKIKDRVDGQLS